MAVFKCKDCNNAFEYETRDGMEWAHPTICDRCAELRKIAQAEALEATRKQRMRNEINRLPYTEWDSMKAGAEMTDLRNRIGAVAFVEGELASRSVWVKGPVACGKTRSVCFIAKTAIERGYHVRYTHCLKLLGDYSEAFEEHQARSFRDGVALDKRVLIIDDYGVGKVTDRGAELLYHIFNEREIHGLITWVTSNITPTQSADWFPSHLYDTAERVWSRVERIGFEVVENK